MTIFGDTSDITIVGVVRHVRMYGLQDEERGQVYRPHAQVPYRQVTVAIRGDDDALRLAAPARAALHAVDPAQPIGSIATMLETVTRSLAERRLVLVLVASFAATALFLAALGVYGVTSTAVAQRTREIGIRVALGAEAGEVVWLMLRQPARLIVVGLVLGLIATVVVAKPLRGLLYNVSATDPVTLTGVSLTLAAVALVAAYLPARRATRVDPATVMRAE
jgi:putative ABC transport system permease protein